MRILAVAGASGGHIFPALAFLAAAGERDASVKTLLVLPKTTRLERRLFIGYGVRFVPYCSLRPGLHFSNLRALFVLAKGMCASLFIILEFKPAIVVGFGSLVSCLVLPWAWLFRLKTVIHEQNVSLGQANRALAFFSDRIALSFAQTKKLLPRYSEKIVVTGNLLRTNLVQVPKKEARDFFGFTDLAFTVLIMGGSQGSHRINAEVVQAISMIEHVASLQFIHVAGEADQQWVKDAYRQLKVKHAVFSFLEQVHYAYSLADLIICRAGATTVAELMLFKIPAIVIPYPFAYDHQLENAKVLEQQGCAVVVTEQELRARMLAKKIEDFSGKPDTISAMRKGYDVFSDQKSTDRFMELIVSLAQHA
ncbi:MAG: UDP-N-acetylglucosamine--N-acetylmuramyl-(pentapeptide) pyrophosphoryl-undecaprenol N-acetylglucosamine transferase [Candidatus Omnitrophica bacterium]|nr:UDP-N-acetylglucosamine--N-acetylmuramyl-(pentapeptide) pyrophosphoryl-undecaprenol N-acetylglucosamine transferase [Candidatus Omnitrophota bacterium]